MNNFLLCQARRYLLCAENILQQITDFASDPILTFRLKFLLAKQVYSKIRKINGI